MNNFWEEKSLNELSDSEWESLCDGCGKCCSHKLIDEENNNKLLFTSITCELFDPLTCSCTDYRNRLKKVPNCLKIEASNEEVFSWLPPTCSYKLIKEAKSLPSWHHLISKDKNLVHSEGHSVQGRVIFEEDLDEDEFIEDYILGPEA